MAGRAFSGTDPRADAADDCSAAGAADDGAFFYQPVDLADQRHLAGLYRRRGRADLSGDAGEQPQHGLPDGGVPVCGAGLLCLLPVARYAGQRGESSLQCQRSRAEAMVARVEQTKKRLNLRRFLR